MTKYRVRPGCRFGVGKRYGPGDIVELEPEHAVTFLDLLEPVAPPPVKAPVKSEPKREPRQQPSAPSTEV